MKIKATIERIPGGMMLIPLLLGAILNTLAPDTGAYFGSFTKGMISGTVPILAVWFFCIGASIDLRATGTVLRKSGTLVITKIAVAWVVAMIAASFIPDTGIQTGFFAGLSVLAIVSADTLTHLTADKMVAKSDPRLGFRAALDSTIALVVWLQIELPEQWQPWLADIQIGRAHV